MINFLNLEYFLVVAEELNFTRATRRLYISQQSLSNHISNLEREFGVILFNRTPPLTLTYAGRALKTRAREFLGPWDEAYKGISDMEDLLTGQLSIGVSHTRGGVTLPETLPIYQFQFPGIELHLAKGDSSQLASDLLHGNIDLMIDLLPFTAENVETAPICNEEIPMVVPDEALKKVHPDQVEEIKEKFRTASDTRLLEHCPFVLLKKGNRVRTITDEILEDAQMSPRIMLETENIETALAPSGKGMGITSYPRIFMSLDPASHSYCSAILEQNHLNLHSSNYIRAHDALGIGYHKGCYMSRAAHESARTAEGRLDHAPQKDNAFYLIYISDTLLPS